MDIMYMLLRKYFQHHLVVILVIMDIMYMKPRKVYNKYTVVILVIMDIMYMPASSDLFLHLL